MPTVLVAASRLGPETTIEAAEGGRLLDLCDDVRAPIRFSCRSVSCGTCRVDVVDGAALLDTPSADEREVLAFFDDPPTHRLACVTHVHAGSGRVLLRVVDDTA